MVVVVHNVREFLTDFRWFNWDFSFVSVLFIHDLCTLCILSLHSNITNAFLLIYQLGTCCIYVVFVATNIKSIADYHFGYETDVRLYMLIILLPLVLINWVNVFFYFLVHFFYMFICLFFIRLFSSLRLIFWLVFNWLGSKFEISCSIFECCQRRYDCIVWHYFVLHFAWANLIGRQRGSWTNWCFSIVFWNSLVRTGSYWSGNYVFHWVLQFTVLFATHFISDYAIGEWNENAKSFRRLNGCAESFNDIHNIFVCDDGTVWLLELWIRHKGNDYTEFTKRRLVNTSSCSYNFSFFWNYFYFLLLTG